MKRTPEPHGTKAAYMRHRRAGEEACAACKRAKPKPKPTREPPLRKETAYDRQIAEHPPEIVWRKNSHGIFVKVSVRDPHVETKAQREWADRLAREKAALAAMEQEAREVAARFEQHRAENTSLMAAARKEI
jgi:hypothetical protein